MNDRSYGRRRFLRAGAVVGTVGIAGCSSLLGGGNDSNGGNQSGDGGTNGSSFDPESEIIGSAMAGRGAQGGTSMKEMPDLSGTLDVYSGRGQALVGTLFSYIQEMYPDFEIRPRYDTSTALVNKIKTEGENSPADVFFSVNAGSLGALADAGRTKQLPKEIQNLVREEFRDPKGHWTGTSGRARTIPYNTDAFSEGEIPDDIFAFPKQKRFDEKMGWAPSYGSFQAFVTAMRLLDGREKTKQWLQGMLDSGVSEYRDEFAIAQAIADNEIQAGFTNHYYIQRVLHGRPDAPLATAFTSNDAGSIFNVAGALVTDTASDQKLAENFVRHLLSSEAQDYFARRTFEYPLVPEVDPIGALPAIDKLNPPDGLDLTQLSDYEPTIKLLREVGINV